MLRADGLSIPFWTLGKRVNTLTNTTWPRSPSVQPEWLNQVRRPGVSRSTSVQHTPRQVEGGTVPVLEWPEHRQSEAPSQEEGPSRPRQVTFDQPRRSRESNASSIGGHWLSGGMEDEAGEADGTADDHTIRPADEVAPDTPKHELPDRVAALKEHAAGIVEGVETKVEAHNPAVE